MDWIGEFNAFIVPFAPFGEFTVTRAVSPHMFDFLYDLSEAVGADPSRAIDTGADAERNGEPYGELGLIEQKDGPLWQDQTGAPIDPQPGNIPGGKRQTLRGVDFNDATLGAFAVDQGLFEVKQGRLEVSPTNLGETASAVFHVGEYLPHYFEMTATISTGKPIAGLKANSYLIFDYISPTDFKYAGINVSNDKLEMGYVDETGWHELVKIPAKLKPDSDYDVLLAINGTTATLVVDNKDILTYAYEARVDDDGFSYGLNYGLVGLGGINSIARVDNMIVQKLAPEITFEATETFDAGAPGFAPTVGDWQLTSGAYQGTSVLPDSEAVSLFDLRVDPNSYLELEVTVSPDTLGGVVFDYYTDGTFKFAGVLADTNQVVIGHVGKSGNIVYDAVADITFSLPSSDEYQLRVALQGATTSVAVLGGKGPNQTWYEVVGHAFNAVTVDGQAGLISVSGQSTFDDFAIRTDDPAFLETGEALTAASSQTDPVEVMSDLSYTDLDPIIEAAINRWTGSTLFDETMLARLDDVTFVIADLAGDTLALAVDDTVIIDVDAAGHGWFVDDTPYQDTEFVPKNSDEELTANESSEAYGDMDLLTVVMHELGHVFGYQDMDPETNDVEIMNQTLDEGVRYLPEGTFTEQVHDNSDSLISMDMTPDEDVANETLDTLVNDNTWLVRYLVDGATDENDPNGDIAVVINDEDQPEESVGADDTSSNPTSGKKN
jgi:hypothetical protein